MFRDVLNAILSKFRVAILGTEREYHYDSAKLAAHSGEQFDINPGQPNNLFSANEDEYVVVGCSPFIAIVASDCYVAESSTLQHEDQLMLAVVFDFLGMDFFLKQLRILP